MISSECTIYVKDKGFVDPADLHVGDVVQRLDGLGWEYGRVEAITCDFVSGRINSIDSGPHNVDISTDARLLYFSDDKGLKYISWDQIPGHTANKEYLSSKYQPVLAWPNFGERNHTDSELESIARLVAVKRYDRVALAQCVENLTSEDAIVLVDMLEFWCSKDPGKGWFGRVQTGTREHRLEDRYFVDELCRVACMAGYTASTAELTPFKYTLRIAYESMPVPGSRPKNEKYHKIFYSGLMYNIDSGNKPILGRSKGRVFYLPTTSILHKKG